MLIGFETEEEFLACQIIALEMGWWWHPGRPTFRPHAYEQHVMIFYTNNTLKTADSESPSFHMSEYTDIIPNILAYGKEKYKERL